MSVDPCETQRVDDPAGCAAEAEMRRWIGEFVARGPANLPDTALRVLSSGARRVRRVRRAA